MLVVLTSAAWCALQSVKTPPQIRPRYATAATSFGSLHSGATSPVGDARVWPELWVTCKIHSWVRWLGIKSVRLRNTKLLQNAKATEPAADALVADE
jgi:hypothetical protein